MTAFLTLNSNLFNHVEGETPVQVVIRVPLYFGGIVCAALRQKIEKPLPRGISLRK
jgi:hypothetical protein